MTREWNRLRVNPAARLRLPKRSPAEARAERVLTREQVDRLLAHAGCLRTETLILAGSTAPSGAARSSACAGATCDSASCAW